MDRGYSSWTITFYTFIFCALGCLPFADVGVIVQKTASMPSLIPWYLGLGLINTMLPYGIYTWALQYLESSRASIIASIEPVVAAVAGVVVYHETLGWVALAGIALVLSAIAVLSLRGKT